MTFDPTRSLAMATFKTVLGHNLPAGHPLVIVDEPSAPGEVDEAMARRLFNAKVAGYHDELHATPVETPEQERNRLALEALRDAPAGDPDALVATDDLNVWPADDAETGKKAGDRVTNDDLRVIAGREGATVESDDNKADLQRKIIERRAALAQTNGVNAETDGAGGQGDTAAQGATGAGSATTADGASDGDAHGVAGEGQGDEGDE